jgi:hypothetical protein
MGGAWLEPPGTPGLSARVLPCLTRFGASPGGPARYRSTFAMVKNATATPIRLSPAIRPEATGVV